MQCRMAAPGAPSAEAAPGEEMAAEDFAGFEPVDEANPFAPGEDDDAFKHEDEFGPIEGFDESAPLHETTSDAAGLQPSEHFIPAGADDGDELEFAPTMPAATAEAEASEPAPKKGKKAAKGKPSKPARAAKPRSRKSLVATLLFLLFGGGLAMTCTYLALLKFVGVKADFLHLASVLPAAIAPFDYHAPRAKPSGPTALAQNTAPAPGAAPLADPDQAGQPAGTTPDMSKPEAPAADEMPAAEPPAGGDVAAPGEAVPGVAPLETSDPLDDLLSPKKSTKPSAAGGLADEMPEVKADEPAVDPDPLAVDDAFATPTGKKTKKPVADEMAEDPLAEKPVDPLADPLAGPAEKPAAEKPSDDLMADDPLAEKPAGKKKPAAEQPSDDLMADDPLAEKPAGKKKPVDDELSDLLGEPATKPAKESVGKEDMDLPPAGPTEKPEASVDDLLAPEPKAASRAKEAAPPEEMPEEKQVKAPAEEMPDETVTNKTPAEADPLADIVKPATDKPSPEKPPEPPAEEPAAPAIAPLNAASYPASVIETALKEAQQSDEQMSDPENIPAVDLKKAKARYRLRLYKLGETITNPAADLDPLALADAKTAAIELLKETAKNPQKVALLDSAAGKWLSFAGREKPSGIVLVGAVSKVAKHGKLFEQQMTIPGEAEPVSVFSATKPTAAEGDRVMLLGSVVDDPAANIPGYTGNQAAAVWSGPSLKLPASE